MTFGFNLGLQEIRFLSAQVDNVAADLTLNGSLNINPGFVWLLVDSADMILVVALINNLSNYLPTNLCTPQMIIRHQTGSG